MTAEQEKGTWRRWHEMSPQLFPLPIELYDDDPGYIVRLLRRIPLELLRDASRYLNPWQELATMELLAPYRSLFLACDSVGAAWQLLASVGWGGATRAKRGYQFSDRLKKAKERGNKAEVHRLERRITDAMLRCDPQTVREIVGSEGVKALTENLCRRSRRPRSEGNRKSANERLNQRYPFKVFLATYWIRTGRGGPGLCFFSNNALATLLSLLDWKGFDVIGEEISSQHIEAFCVDLGLRKANKKFPEFSDARLTMSGLIQLNPLPPKRAREEFPKDAPYLYEPLYVGEHMVYGGRKR